MSTFTLYPGEITALTDLQTLLSNEVAVDLMNITSTNTNIAFYNNFSATSPTSQVSTSNVLFSLTQKLASLTDHLTKIQTLLAQINSVLAGDTTVIHGVLGNYFQAQARQLL